MRIQDKPPAIVQCSLGDMRHPITKTSVPRPHSPAHILLRWDGPASPPRGFDLVLDIGQATLPILRHTLDRLTDRYHVIAFVPPNGTAFAAQEAARLITQVAEERHLPSFGSRALAIAGNRFLTLCHWQMASLPTVPFALVQFPSALTAAAATMGYPAQLSPLTYALPHLVAHVHREGDLAKAHQLVSRVMHRHALSHPSPSLSDGCDPRTGHHIRFSPSTDMLLTASRTSESCALTVITRKGQPKAQICKGPRLQKMEVHTICELATAACKVLDIQNGVATCMVRHGPRGSYLEGIIPQYADNRLLPAIGKKYLAAFLLP